MWYAGAMADSTSSNPSTRALILSRRARYVAMGLAAAGLSSTTPVIADGGTDAESADASDQDSSVGDGEEAEPQVCLCACEAPGTSDLSGTTALAVAGLVAGGLAVRRRRPNR